MQAHFHNLVILVVAAQLVHQTIPGSSAPIGDENEVVARTTTSSSFPAALTDDVAEQSQGERTSETNPTFPVGRFGWEIGVNIASGFDDGSYVVDVGRGQIKLRIGQGGIITEIFAGDVSFFNRTLAEYYPALDEYLRSRQIFASHPLGPKETEEVLNFFKELDSLESIPLDDENAVEEIEDDDEEVEAANLCPICRRLISRDDFLVLDCQHEFHIRCIWNWRRMSRDSTCPLCRNPFDI